MQIGGGATVVVQSMTNTDTRDVEATVAQIHALEELGCEIIRIAVPDNDAVEAIPLIKKRIAIPLIADIPTFNAPDDPETVDWISDSV